MPRRTSIGNRRSLLTGPSTPAQQSSGMVTYSSLQPPDATNKIIAEIENGSVATNGRLTRARSARSLAASSVVDELSFDTTESISSALTPFGQTSESGYSTPGTSKLPSPAEAASKTSQFLEVRIPAKSRLQETDGDERALRHSVYSLSSKAKGKRVIEIDDSDEEDDDDVHSGNSRDAQVARRMQNEEYRKANLRSRRSMASDIQSPAPAEASVKRTRSLSGPSSAQKRPAKKSKIIPDSDDAPESGLDLDAEIAAAAALDEQLANEVSSSDDDDSVTERRTRSTEQKKRLTNVVFTDPKTIADMEEPPLALPSDESSGLPSDLSGLSSGISSATVSDSESEDSEVAAPEPGALRRIAAQRRAYRRSTHKSRTAKERDRLEKHHPELVTMWTDLENTPVIDAGKIDQPASISRQLKPFQLEGVAWMKEMEKTEWKGGLLGDEMGLGKTIQAVSLIMSDYPAKQPTLVLVPPVALMQWQSEIKSYTDGTLKTFVFHGTNQKAKNITVKELKKFDVIMMSYNSLESMYRKQEKGFKRKDGIYKEKSVIHSITFHRAILDEAHCIKTRTTMTAKACFALKTEYRWCLTGTPLQNRIGELFSLVRFLNIKPFALYLCKQCTCSRLEWSMDDSSRCSECNHAGMQHVSVFNQELLNPIQKFGNLGPGREAFRKLRLMTSRIMLRRLKKDHTNSMELPVKEVYVDRQFFGEEENDFANSIMTNGQRKFDTYVAQGVLLNNYANIFGLIMQMRQVADHPDLILKKNADGGQNVLVCCICDEPAEDTIKSRCKHDFCRTCVSAYIKSTDEPDCPRCHIGLVIDLEQPEIEQDEAMVKKSSIINRIKMENWTSSSKIELLVHELHKLRSDNATHKSIIFSQFTTMLQLIEWRLRRAGITTVMLDGSMTPAQRQASIEHFMNNIDVECFLVSLKAGGVALNLTEASRVFIIDP
jgi:DNA repair protein RAD16